MTQTPLAQLPPRSRVVVLRALPGLGDFLCALPALRSLRSGLPGAQVTLLGLPGTRALAARFPHLIDSFLDFPGFPGLPELPANVTALPAFLTHVQGRFDLALQLHGSGAVSNVFAQLLGAKVTAGCYPMGAACPDSRTFVPYPEGLPEPRRALAVTAFLGLPFQGDELEFPMFEADRAELDGLRLAEYAVIHPGASEARRRWKPEFFAEVADELAARGLEIVLTGTASEAGVTAAVKAVMRADAIDLVGRTSLGATAALLEGARLLVTNDTGISHLASATKTKSVVVFLASDPSRWAPLNAELHRAVVSPSPDEVLGHALAHLSLRKEAACDRFAS